MTHGGVKCNCSTVCARKFINSGYSTTLLYTDRAVVFDMSIFTGRINTSRTSIQAACMAYLALVGAWSGRALLAESDESLMSPDCIPSAMRQPPANNTSYRHVERLPIQTFTHLISIFTLFFDYCTLFNICTTT